MTIEQFNSLPLGTEVEWRNEGEEPSRGDVMMAEEGKLIVWEDGDHWSLEDDPEGKDLAVIEVVSPA